MSMTSTSEVQMSKKQRKEQGRAARKEGKDTAPPPAAKPTRGHATAKKRN